MRHLEIRRHSIRSRPDQHLSREGVTLARRVGGTMGRFARVITSREPRAFETAIAMGYAVDHQWAQIADMGDAVSAEISYPASFAAFAAAYSRGEATWRLGPGAKTRGLVAGAR